MEYAGRDKQAYQLALFRHLFAVNILKTRLILRQSQTFWGFYIEAHREYTRVVDSLKEAATNSLLELKIYQYGKNKASSKYV